MSNRIVLVSHLGLASGMKKALEFIVGEQAELYAIELDEDGIEAFKEKLFLLQRSHFDGATIIVSDIPSGSPGATAYSMLSENKEAYLLSGMNLPLLLELLLSRSVKSVEELISDGIQSAKEAIQEYTMDLEQEPVEDF